VDRLAALSQELLHSNQPALLHAEVTVGFGAQVEVSGARPQQNNYRLDGVSLNDYANGGPRQCARRESRSGCHSEFSVLTSNYSAEYGKSSGGVVNAITRSGTNDFHGSAYEFCGTVLLTRAIILILRPFRLLSAINLGVSAGGRLTKSFISFSELTKEYGNHWASHRLSRSITGS